MFLGAHGQATPQHVLVPVLLPVAVLLDPSGQNLHSQAEQARSLRPSHFGVVHRVTVPSSSFHSPSIHSQAAWSPFPCPSHWRDASYVTEQRQASCHAHVSYHKVESSL